MFAANRFVTDSEKNCPTVRCATFYALSLLTIVVVVLGNESFVCFIACNIFVNVKRAKVHLAVGKSPS